tara:strand:+ start:47 stop:889 length:843 start_codon:yes stop_codon:yes gene_type:complete
MHCDISSEDRSKYLAELKEDRLDWIEIYEKSAEVDSRTADMKMATFFDSLKNNNVPADQIAKVVISERIRQWVDIALAAEGLSEDEIQELAGHFEQVRAHAVLRLAKIDELNDHLTKFLDEYLSDEGEFVDEKQELDRAEIQNIFRKFVPAEKYAAHFTMREMVFLLMNRLETGYPDVAKNERLRNLICRIVGKSYYMARFKLLNLLSAQDHEKEMEDELKREKKKEDALTELYRKYGGKKLKTPPGNESEEISSKLVEFGMDPYKGLDLRGISDYEQMA